MRRNTILHFCLLAGNRVLPFVPLRIAYILARAAGLIAYYVAAGPRHALQANLAQVLRRAPDSREVRLASRRTFQHDAQNWLDTLRIPRLTALEIRESVPVMGWDNVDDALLLGKGLVMVGLHLGNFDLVGQLLRVNGVSLTIPVERVEPERLFQFLVDLRTSKGINAVALDRAPRAMLSALRRGEAVGILGDRAVAGRSIEVSFFGGPAHIPRAPVSLARHLSAPLVVACGIRVRDQHFQGFVTPALHLVNTGNAEADDQVNAQRLADVMQIFIRHFVGQWMVFTHIWTEHTVPQRVGTISHQREATIS